MAKKGKRIPAKKEAYKPPPKHDTRPKKPTPSPPPKKGK